jgi:hypothetical protein
LYSPLRMFNSWARVMVRPLGTSGRCSETGPSMSSLPSWACCQDDRAGERLGHRPDPGVVAQGHRVRAAHRAGAIGGGQLTVRGAHQHRRPGTSSSLAVRSNCSRRAGSARGRGGRGRGARAAGHQRTHPEGRRSHQHLAAPDPGMTDVRTAHSPIRHSDRSTVGPWTPGVGINWITRGTSSDSGRAVPATTTPPNRNPRYTLAGRL